VPGADEAVDGPAEAEYRPLLFSIAYGMTGSAGDAEDIVQDAFLGLTRARKAGTTITDPKAYLATAVMRLGINYQKSARVRRETYVGDWLPEPIVVPVDGTGPAEHAELADSLSMAFLVLLETLSPVERAVFMLREVFGYGYPDVARITGKTEANCRQIFSRARQRIGAGGQVRDSAPSPARRAEGEELARRFFETADGGDMDPLLGMLAPDVVFYADGGGKAQAIGVPLHGRQPVARLLAGLFRRGRFLGTSLRLAWVNGQPGAVGYDAAGQVFTVFELEVADGVVQAIRAVVNPDKLRHIGPVSDVARLPEKELPQHRYNTYEGGIDERLSGHRRPRRDRGPSRRVHRRGDDARPCPPRIAVHARRRAADAQHPRRNGRPGTDPHRGRAAAKPVGLLRADHASGHDPAGRRHRDRPCLHP
jgi:RNA polymerase sigma-70 factor (ECF subfamily)